MRVIVALLSGLVASTAGADSMCYDVWNSPVVWHPQKTEAGIRFLTHAAQRDGLRPHEEQMTWVAGNAEGFHVEGTEECNSWRCAALKDSDACPEDMPAIIVSSESLPDAQRLDYAGFEQGPGACVTVGDEVYFGLAFYEGEGAMGMGGVGRWNRLTGKLEVRHPKELRSISVNHIAFDGKRLWMGTYEDAECSGEIPASRVVVYDWEKDRFEGQWQHVPNLLTCGFVVQGFVQESPEYMWVASDIGITRVKIVEHSYDDRVGFGSQHWWAEQTPDGLVMKEGECTEEYDHLLRTLTLRDIPTYESPLDQFVGTLMRYNRHYVQQHFLEKIYRDRGLSKIAAAYRHSGGQNVLQDCETGRLYIPRGKAWEDMVSMNGPTAAPMDAAVRTAWQPLGRVLPAEVEGGLPVLEVHGLEFSTDVFGHCAGLRGTAADKRPAGEM